ncbi:class I SAM-dependent methyltransferase [Umezawaea endophytica]|uniref:class I SAM-dependent methyltransferase n=1 Tax=Umezawaea endophytica TaxID=1654476 RepID=UPI0027E25C5B|nr:class I SAM-dependent methyltransferase [Umezawaea endophytica]
MELDVKQNRKAWEAASQKHVREYDELLAQARDETSLFPREQELLRPLLRPGPVVVHPQSGHGLDDIALVAAGATRVVGVDFSPTAVASARRRAVDLGVPCHYVVGQMPGAPLANACADVVYTGKGALIWMPDLDAWATDVARLLRPGGWLFLYESHPAVPLWTWDEDEPRIRGDRGYFERGFVNDTFPGHGAVEAQATLGEVVTAVVRAGMEVRVLEEYAEPFWRAGGVDAAAWRGSLPNSFALMARKVDVGG